MRNHLSLPGRAVDVERLGLDAQRLGSCLRSWLRPGLGLCLAVLGAAAPAQAQSGAESTAEPSTQAVSALRTSAAQFRVTAERVKLPGDETMGLVGTSYLVEFAPGWSVGPAAYGAITGERGGLFTVGAELGAYRRLSGPLGVDVGLYVGGGGGGSAPVGSGLMLRPHADLVWEFGGQRAGLSVSKVRFSEGRIDSTQIGLVWTVLTDFRHLGWGGSVARSSSPPALGEQILASGRSGIGFDRIQAVLGSYSPRAGSLKLDGTPYSGRIGLAGTRFEQSLNDGLYWGVEAAGAASGGVAGYAEYLGTVGLETALIGDLVYAGARLAVGMGGGGLVDVGGGLLVKGGVHGTLRLSGDLGVAVEAGLARAPQGSFRARYASASLVWVLDNPRSGLDAGHAVRTEWVGGVERYPAARRDGSTRELRAVTLRVNRFVSDRFYLTGQAHSALGGGAGGYTVGLLGAGFQQRWAGRWHAGVEALAGAAGGGGVDTAGGLIVQPMAYVGYDLSRDWALRIGGGRIQSLRGALKGPVTEVSLAYTFGVGGRGGR